MSQEATNTDTARRYLEAVAHGAQGETLAAFFTPDVIQEEFPNRLVPDGARRDLTALLDAAVRGQSAVSSQTFDVRGIAASGDYVAVEILWSGTLAMAFGALSVGDVMRARIAMFLEFRDGKIARQRNYDCYEPW